MGYREVSSREVVLDCFKVQSQEVVDCFRYHLEKMWVVRLYLGKLWAVLRYHLGK